MIQSVRQELLEEQESSSVSSLDSLIDGSDNKNVVSSHYNRRKSDSEERILF